MRTGWATWFVGVSAKWKREALCWKIITDFKKATTELSTEHGALWNLVPCVTFVQPAQVQGEMAVQEGEACISASPVLAPSQLGLSQRSALNSPSSVNCSPPSTFAPHLRLSVSSVYIVVPRKSHRYWVLKGLRQGVKGDTPRGFPIKAALLPLSRTLTSSPTMGFSLSLWVWQNPL